MTRIDAHDDDEPALQGFWGLQLQPGKAYTQVVEAGFRVTMAALTDKIVSEKSRSCVQVEVDNTTFVLCSLLPGRCEQQMLDTVFSEGETLRLSVTGSNPVDLTGYYLPPPDAMDYEMDSDEYDSDLELDMDESDMDESDMDESDEDESDEDESDEDVMVERAPPGKITEIPVVRSIPITSGDSDANSVGKRKAPESSAQPQKKQAAETKTPVKQQQQQQQKQKDAKTPQQQKQQDAKTPQQQKQQDAKTPQQQKQQQQKQAATPAAKPGQQPSKTPDGKQQQKVHNKSPGGGKHGKKGKGK